MDPCPTTTVVSTPNTRKRTAPSDGELGTDDPLHAQSPPHGTNNKRPRSLSPRSSTKDDNSIDDHIGSIQAQTQGSTVPRSSSASSPPPQLAQHHHHHHYYMHILPHRPLVDRTDRGGGLGGGATDVGGTTATVSSTTAILPALVGASPPPPTTNAIHQHHRSTKKNKRGPQPHLHLALAPLPVGCASSSPSGCIPSTTPISHSGTHNSSLLGPFLGSHHGSHHSHDGPALLPYGSAQRPTMSSHPHLHALSMAGPIHRRATAALGSTPAPLRIRTSEPPAAPAGDRLHVLARVAHHPPVPTTSDLPPHRCGDGFGK